MTFKLTIFKDLKKLSTQLITKFYLLGLNHYNEFHPYQKQLACQPKICMFDHEENKYVDLESKVYIKYLGALMEAPY